METLSVLGYGLALVIGLIMGLLGGGGSILTVPVFVYLLGFDSVIATAYSLFVIGITSIVGTGRNIIRGNIDFRSALVFGIPSFISIYLTRRYLIPMIPEDLMMIGNYYLTRKSFMMLFFALLLIVAAVPMIKKKRNETVSERTNGFPYGFIALQGVVVGLLAGMVGAGGGFLIIPVLVLVSKLPMKIAVGTTLLIISFNSLIGFLGDVQNTTIDWNFLLPFTTLSVIGILIGISLAKYVPGDRLKRWFGYFVLGMAVFILIKELVAN